MIKIVRYIYCLYLNPNSGRGAQTEYRKGIWRMLRQCQTRGKMIHVFSSKTEKKVLCTNDECQNMVLCTSKWHYRNYM